MEPEGPSCTIGDHTCTGKAAHTADMDWREKTNNLAKSARRFKPSIEAYRDSMGMSIHTRFGDVFKIMKNTMTESYNQANKEVGAHRFNVKDMFNSFLGPKKGMMP